MPNRFGSSTQRWPRTPAPVVVQRDVAANVAGLPPHQERSRLGRVGVTLTAWTAWVQCSRSGQFTLVWNCAGLPLWSAQWQASVQIYQAPDSCMHAIAP